MSDREEAPSLGPETILTAEEIEAIERRVALERSARRRKSPPWNPDHDPPWRPLEHCFIAALKGCNEISTRKLEAVLARGKTWITGIRSDVIGDFMPDRIEVLVATAEQRIFFFHINEIWTTRSHSRDRVLVRTGAINFRDVRVHWPTLVMALQEAGFKISLAPKQASPRGGSPPPAAQRVAIQKARPRGRPQRPTAKKLDDHFKRTFKKGDKRDPAIKDCCAKTGATWREALAAYQRIPDKLRRKRGGQSRSS